MGRGRPQYLRSDMRFIDFFAVVISFASIVLNGWSALRTGESLLGLAHLLMTVSSTTFLIVSLEDTGIEI